MRATVNDGTLGSNGFVSAIFHSVVVAANVQNVSLSPLDPTVTAGSPITLTASGGANGYVWGGSASGAGANKTLTFNTPGSYAVTVYSPAGGVFAQSNTATAAITVSSPAPSASITASPTAGIAPLTTVISWATAYATSATVSGPGLNSAALSGGSSLTLPAGTYVYSVAAVGPSGSASASVSVSVAANTATLSAGSSSVDFGSVFRDTLAGSPTTAARTLTLSNPGNAPLTITAISFSGGPFSHSGLALPYSLAAGGSVGLGLTFGPGAVMGANSATLTITATSNSATVALSGIGLAPKLQVTWP
jgi:hypothetical protein